MTHEPSSGVFELARGPAESRTSVLVVDDFTLVGEGLAATFELERELELAGLATDGRTALRLPRENLLRRTQAADLDQQACRSCALFADHG